MDKILRDKKAIFVFIAPALIMFLLVLIIPTIQMVYYSLCDYAALTPPEFVGLKNYKKLFFGDATFRIALKNSIFFMIFSAVTQQIFGLLLAVNTEEMANKVAEAKEAGIQAPLGFVPAEVSVTLRENQWRFNMASLVERNGRYCVVYSYKDKTGKRRQKWETYKTMQEAKKRKKEIEYRADVGQMVVPHCKTVKDLMEEYITLYGKEAWALSTYSSNVSMINNYIVPIIGGDKLENINTRFIEKYYQRLLRTPAVVNPATGKR